MSTCVSHPAPSAPREKRTRTGRGPHGNMQRNGRGPDAGLAVSPWEMHRPGDAAVGRSRFN
eukprot:gene24329-biopygen10431